MRFMVSQRTNIICEDCGASTLVMGDNIYDTNDLTCVCNVQNYIRPILFEEEQIEALSDKPEGYVEDKGIRLGVQHKNSSYNKTQGSLLETIGDNVPKELEMSEAEVMEYLESLSWTEVMRTAAKNGIAKRSKDTREELTARIILKVFYGEDS